MSARYRGLGRPTCLRLLASAAVVLVAAHCASPPKPAPRSVLPDASNPWRYALVIDASSSASTLQIFEWKPGLDGRLPKIEAAPRNRDLTGDSDWSLRVKPGLANFSGSPDAAAASLEPLVRYALEKIGDDALVLENTSLLVRATAGMRLLDPADEVEISMAVEEYLESTPFGRTSMRVITGAEEGIFGWLSINYLLGHLDHGGRFPTVGALDLGGASAQVTFLPLDFPKQSGHTIRLGSHTYALYTKSYLGLGQDQARERVASPACFLVGYPTPEGPGTGDFDACRHAIREALSAPCSEDTEPCSLLGAYPPPLYGHFLALSVYAYTSDFFGLRERLRPEAMESRGREFCARDWQEWTAEEPEVADDPYRPLYCYSAAHVVTLLTDGLGFPADSDQISAPLRVQGSSIGWTLGALLYELAGRPSD